MQINYQTIDDQLIQLSVMKCRNR